MLDIDDDRDRPADDADQVVSDRTVRRLLYGVVGLIVAAIVVAGFVAAIRWVVHEDDDQSLNSVDVGFLQDMIDHHLQAIEIAEAYLSNNPDGGAAPYAREVVLYQTREIERMDEWLAADGYGRGDPNRQAMQWMGMDGVPVAEMDGMQDPADIATLATLTGDDADRMFFTMMTAHHEGGAHMGDAAAEGANNDVVRTFAGKMADGQRVEIVEYQQAWERLGL